MILIMKITMIIITITISNLRTLPPPQPVHSVYVQESLKKKNRQAESLLTAWPTYFQSSTFYFIYNFFLQTKLFKNPFVCSSVFPADVGKPSKKTNFCCFQSTFICFSQSPCLALIHYNWPNKTFLEEKKSAEGRYCNFSRCCSVNFDLPKGTAFISSCTSVLVQVASNN